MTLLEDIQPLAVGAKNDVGTILRKCKLLAPQLDNNPLQEWIIWESNGYPEPIWVIRQSLTWSTPLKNTSSVSLHNHKPQTTRSAEIVPGIQRCTRVTVLVSRKTAIVDSSR